MLKKLTPYYIILTITFVLVVSLLNAKNDSATFDEIAHIPAGYSSITEYDMRLNPEHPPLIKALATIPLLFLDLHFDTTQPYWKSDINGQWDAGRHFLYKSENNADAIVFWSRVPIIFIGIALGLFLFWWGRRWLGLTGGLIAFTLVMFDPNILGHNHYVTTDIGITAFLTFSIYFFLAFLKCPTWKNVFFGGFFFGLAHLAKFSSVLLLPLFLIALLIYPLFRKKEFPTSRWKIFLESIGKGAVAFFISILLVWIAYAGFFYKTPPEMVQRTIDFYFPTSDTRPLAQETNTALTTLNSNAITRPLGEYLLGVGMVFKRVAGGNGAYFMGEVSSTAFPSYFPTVFILKETLPLLSLLLIAGLFSIGKFFKGFAYKESFFREQKNRFLSFISENPTLWTISGFVVLYTYLSVTGNLNIGFRHLFPILPFLYLLIAKQYVDILKKTKHLPHFIMLFILSSLLLLNIVTTLCAYPYYMSYFNPIAGGSKNGYNYVTDSNADWGQDLKRLNEWINIYNACAQTKCDPNMGVGCPSKCYSIAKPFPTPHNQIEKIRVDYFGGGDILKTIGEDQAILWWDSRRPIEPGWYAISVNFSQGSIHEETKTENNSYRWLKNHTPVAQVGTSIFIYFIK